MIQKNENIIKHLKKLSFYIECTEKKLLYVVNIICSRKMINYYVQLLKILTGFSCSAQRET